MSDASQPFFLTASWAAAVVSKAMFKMFSETVGLPRASTNTLRKAGTTNLREMSKLFYCTPGSFPDDFPVPTIRHISLVEC